MPSRKPGRVKKTHLRTEAELQLRDNIRPALQKFWESTKRKLDTGDARTMEMVARMVQYDKGPGGVTIFNQHLQMNNAIIGESAARVRSFDQIIGKLEEQEKMSRQTRSITAALENSEPDEEDDGDDDQEEDTEDIKIIDAMAELVTQE